MSTNEAVEVPLDNILLDSLRCGLPALLLRMVNPRGDQNTRSWLFPQSLMIPCQHQSGGNLTARSLQFMFIWSIKIKTNFKGMETSQPCVLVTENGTSARSPATLSPFRKKPHEVREEIGWLSDPWVHSNFGRQFRLWWMPVEDSKRVSRRRQAAELKRPAPAACAEPGASLAQVAHTHDLNAKLVHKSRCTVDAGGATRSGGQQAWPASASNQQRDRVRSTGDLRRRAVAFHRALGHVREHRIGSGTPG